MKLTSNTLLIKHNAHPDQSVPSLVANLSVSFTHIAKCSNGKLYIDNGVYLRERTISWTNKYPFHDI